jgi:hypothetical protein
MALGDMPPEWRLRRQFPHTETKSHLRNAAVFRDACALVVNGQNGGELRQPVTRAPAARPSSGHPESYFSVTVPPLSTSICTCLPFFCAVPA